MNFNYKKKKSVYKFIASREMGGGGGGRSV